MTVTGRRIFHLIWLIPGMTFGSLFPKVNSDGVMDPVQ